MVVVEDWDNQYCDENSTIYKVFVQNIQKVYEEAGANGDLSNIYQRFEVKAVTPENNPDACASSPTTKRKSRSSSRRAQSWTKRVSQTPRTRRPKTDDNLLVKGYVVLRETSSYTNDAGDKFKDALVTVVENSTIMDQVNLTITDSSTIIVDGARLILCGNDLSCTNKTECINTYFPETNETKGVCRCSLGLVDFSPNPEVPGEVCVQGCSKNFCVHGKCQLNDRIFTRSCSCSTWYFTGEKCTRDMRIVIGMSAAVLVIGILLAGLLLYRRRREQQQTLAARESADPPHLPEGQVNEAYWTLRRDDDWTLSRDDDWTFRRDDDLERDDKGYAWAEAANVAAFERQRPWQDRLLEIIGDEDPQMPSGGPAMLPRLGIRRASADTEPRVLQALDLQGWERDRPRSAFISLRPGIPYGSLEDLYRGDDGY
ncbi:uncharacterized protein LOC122243342 [Penaeus japonicus]|uniref:uncharacterized protein LOC122243342 n=1 Tax=Penaeus japonicus TaxID=27405 RepID=UPI001C715D6B|nr:uncharacterized protein LOC122243342 [Penaeus japonicus]